MPPDGSGDPVTSWWNGFSIAVGLLVVAMGAFLSGAYLVVEASRRSLPRLHAYFRIRALVAGIAALLAGIAAAIMLDIDSSQMFQRFVHRSIPLLVVGLIALAVTFVMAARGVARGLRVVAGLGVGALVWAWGVAQYDYLLPFKMTIAQGSGADTTMKWLIGWAIAALVTVVPLLIFLYSLGQRGQLGEDPTTSVGPEPLIPEAPQSRA